MSDSSRQVAPGRRARIVDAARHLILRHGLRATTMQAVAREAKVAKATLYSYFPDKDAIFVAIVQSLVDDILNAFNAALDGEGDPVDQIGAALTARYRVIGDLLEGSPHAHELYSEHDRSTAAQFAAVDRQIEYAIALALKKAGVLRSRSLAQLLLASAYGIGRRSRSTAEAGTMIRLMVERLTRPELG